MKLLFFGSGAFGIPTLASLVERHQVAMIVTQPDKPAGRGSQLTPTPIAQWAAEHAPSIPVIKPQNVNESLVLTDLRDKSADAWVVIAFGQKLSQPLLDGIFAINLHASLLPRWRGAAPIHAAMLAGDQVTGNSVITLADKMDAGLVLGQSTRTVEPSIIVGEMHDLLAADGPALVEQVLAQHATGTVQGKSQDAAAVTIARKLSRADGWVDFALHADLCRRRIHSLTPWPGILARFDKPDPAAKPVVELKLLRAQVVEGSSAPANAPPGTLIQRDGQGVIACGEQTLLRLVEIQPSGRKPMSWEQYANGARLDSDLILSTTPPPSLQQTQQGTKPSGGG
jgi:methionyl-tRNA formyltransferase